MKINAAMQAGGPGLAISTVHAVTGVPVNHVIVVNFSDFKGLIDALGGVTIDVPKPILSNRFDCPFATQTRCLSWPGWRFAKGRQHMDGRRALIYSRVRENQLDPASTDFTRQARQQAVSQAVMAKLTSVGTLLSLPFDGGSLVKPVSTDLSAKQLVELGSVKFRSSFGSALHCRLGGDFGAGGTGQPSEDNLPTIAAFLGKSAPQPPTSTFGPGCAVGARAPVSRGSGELGRFDFVNSLDEPESDDFESDDDDFESDDVEPGDDSPDAESFTALRPPRP